MFDEHSSDGVLVKAARDGETLAFELLFDRHASNVLTFARAWTRDDRLAEDVLQEAFLRAWRHLAQLADGEKFGPWLWRITLNSARDEVRAQLREGPRDSPIAAPISPSDEVERRLVLREAVSRLPEDLRAAVTLYYLSDLSERETAAVLGWRVGTLKSRLHRAREKLAEVMRVSDGEEFE